LATTHFSSIRETVRPIEANFGLPTQFAVSSQIPGAKHSRRRGVLQQIVSVFSILSQVFRAAIRKLEKSSQDALILQVARAPEDEPDRVPSPVAAFVHENRPAIRQCSRDR
jgi:hypothetical protein